MLTPKEVFRPIEPVFDDQCMPFTLEYYMLSLFSPLAREPLLQIFDVALKILVTDNDK